MGAASLIDEAIRWIAAARNASIFFGHGEFAIGAMLVVAIVWGFIWWRRRRNDPLYRYR